MAKVVDVKINKGAFNSILDGPGMRSMLGDIGKRMVSEASAMCSDDNLRNEPFGSWVESPGFPNDPNPPVLHVSTTSPHGLNANSKYNILLKCLKE